MSLRRIWRATLWLCAGVVVLALAALLALHSAPARRYVLRQLQSVEGVRAADVDYNLLAGTAVLTGLEIGPLERPFLRAPRIEFDAALRALLGGRVVIESVVADNLSIDLVIDAEGRANLPDFGPAEGSPLEQLPDVLVERLRMSGSFTFTDPTAVVSIPAWVLSATGSGGPQHAVRLATEPGRVRVGEWATELAAATLAARVTRRDVTVEQLRAGISGVEVNGAGNLADFADPQLDLRLTAVADLARALAPFPEAGGLSGQLTAQAAITGRARAVVMQAALAGRELAAPPVRGATLDAQVNWSADDGVLRVTTARVTAPEGAISWSAVLAGEDREVDARLERLDLARISRLAQLPVTIASTASGALRARWQGMDLEAGAVEADVRLSAAEVRATRELIPVAGGIQVRLRNREATVAVSELAALATTADAAIVTHLGRRDLAGAVHLRVPDIAPLLALAGVETNAGGRAEAEAVLGGVWDHPAATVTLTGEGLHSGPLEHVTLLARARYDPARIEVEEARVRWQGAELVAEGAVGLDDPAHPLRFTARSTEVDIALALSALGYGYPVAGRISINARGDGTLAAPRVEATVTGRDLVAYAESIGALDAEMRYTHPEVTVPRLRIERPRGLGDVSGSASYNLEARTYSANLTGAGLVVERAEARAVVDVALRGTGSIDDPAAEFEIAAQDVVAENYKLGALTIRGTLENRQAAMRIEAPRFRTRAEARVAIDAPYWASLAAQIEDLDLPDLPVQGSVTASLEASGELEHWEDLSAAATVSALRIETPLGEVRNAAPLRLAYRNRTVEVEPAEWLAPGARLAIRGALPGALAYEGEADLAALAMEGLEAAGRLRLAGTLTGGFERMTPAAEVSLRDGRLASPDLPKPLERVELEAKLDGGLLRVERASATLGTGLLSGQGAIPLRLFPLPPQLDVPEMSGPARFQFALTGLTLASVADLPPGVNGAVTLTLDAQAERPELDAVTGTLTIPQLIIGAAGVRLQTTATAPVLALRGGAVQIERFALTGQGAELEVRGGFGFRDQLLRDAQVTGNLNVGLLAAFVEGLNAAGDINLRVAAEGPLSAPHVTGLMTLAGGRFGLRDPRVDAANVEMLASLDGQRVRIQELTGEVNGGTLEARGEVDLEGRMSADVTVALRDVFLEAPAGLQTRSSADLRLRPRDGALLLSGEVTVQEGGYNQPLDLQRALQAYLEPAGGVTLAQERNPLLERLQFDIAVRSADPVVLDNNLGRLTFGANLRVVGDYYRPGLTGRVEIGEEGRLRLQERDYIVERGVINFVNEARIEPLLDIVANTQVRDRQISVRIGTDAQGEVTADLTSDSPEDTRADIVALLLTGKTAEELEGGQMQQAGERAALSLLAGSFSGRLTQQVRTGLGATAVRIEPNLISQESDPTARLTLGQDLTRFLQLIYSMNLRNSSDQIWSVNYNVRPRINTRATKQDDNTYRFDFQHDVRFGLGRGEVESRPAAPPMRVAAVEFRGDLRFAEEEVREVFRVRAGDPYSFFSARAGLTRLERFYERRGYLEARLRMRREEQGRDVTLRLEVVAGPQVEFVFEGWNPPGRIREQVAEDWQRGVFDSQRSDAGLARIAAQLARDGYLQPALAAEVRTPEPGRKSVLFTIDRGPRYRREPIAFEGAQAIRAEALREQLRRAKLLDQPKQAGEFLRGYYQQEGFLDVRVDGPEYEFDEGAGRARLVARIEEGPRYRWGNLAIEGANALTRAEIQAAARIRAGALYTPLEAQESRDRVEEEYWRRGYRDVRISYNLTRDPQQGLVHLAATIDEGPQSVVREIAVEGTRVVTERFVRDQIAFRPGDAFDFTKTNTSRRHLYDTGAFSAVELRSEVLPQEASGAFKNVRLLATVQEPSPYRLRYGAFFDTERGPGAIVDLRNRNTLGGGRVAGFRGRFDYDVREARGFFSQPLIRSLPLRTDATVFFRKEFQRTRLDDGTQDVFITDRIGASVQEGWQLLNRFFLTFGYRFERAHTYEAVANEFLPFDETVRIAPLTASLTRDTRDDILDATRGSFASVAGELAAARLGSTLTFGRVFGQYFRYFPLTAPAPVPFGGGLERSRVVFATGVRLGIAQGLGGQTIVRSQRFFTGGGTTLRGFAQDSVGPVDILGRPRGGEALLLLNNELRFPVKGLLDGVAFLDVGNVYRTVEQMRLSDVRKTAGPGLRVRTPYFLLRLDYGLKLDRQPGESRGAFFFSIGQAF